ncbi:MAG: hypothetical protein GY854_24900 [Deltaproteobacteria bacterium]|nr:hypothetical protein [Deltaproteobacteria bacterium]
MPWPFKKTRPISSYKEIAPKGLIDLHSHVLPGLDDGPAGSDESIAILDGMAALGYVSVACTPHFNNDALIPDTATQEKLIAEIATRRNDKPPELLTGAEVLFDDRFLAAEGQGRIPRIGSGRIYLIEFGFNPGSVPPGIEEMFFRFQIKEGTLILAHPERIPDFVRDTSLLEQVAHAGAILQIDLLSLAAKYGRRTRRKAWEFLEEGLADIVASDLHSQAELSGLDRALRDLADWDREEFVRLASSNPLKILEGRPNEVLRHA